jgi:TolA-binding protein
MGDDNSLKGRVTRQGEETIGRLAQELLENPAVTRALSAAFDARERATRAQEMAMGALNLPSASDLERLTRRVRSVSQRLEGIEDGLDRLEERLGRANGTKAMEDRLDKIEATLERLEQAGSSPAAKPAAASAKRAPASAKPAAASAKRAPASAKPAAARKPRPASSRPVRPEPADPSTQ